MSICRDYVRETDGPVWPDLCGHGKDCYVGSVEQYTPKGSEKYDVYVYNEKCYTDKKGYVQHVCIRYGKKQADHISGGELVQFILSAGGENWIDIYRAAIGLLELKGGILWDAEQKKT